MTLIEYCRSICEQTYTDSFTLTTQQPITGPHGQTDFEPVTSESIPCRFSHVTTQSNTEEHGAGEQRQITKIFLSPDVIIPSGSVITVTHDGRTEAYKASSPPAVYQTHQEVYLTLKDRWA